MNDLDTIVNEDENYDVIRNEFIHLHWHTTYSFLDGANNIKEGIARCKELGMNAVAITDHGNLAGIFDFHEQCEEQNMKPIYGIEMYQTWDTSILSLNADERRNLAIEAYEKDTGNKIPEKINGKKITITQINQIINDYMYDTKQYHLILLAMNQTGFNNLIKLQSEASDVCNYNGRFCCDFDMLRKYNEGLICLSACIGGIIPSTILKGDYEKAEELTKTFKDIFGDRFYLEIQPLLMNQQVIVNTALFDIAKKYNIELVATNDVHYTLEEDADDHDTLLCVGTGKVKSDTERMRYDHEFWIRSKNEMIEAFDRNHYDKDIINKAIQNTVIIANRIEENIKLGSDKPLFPQVKVPKHFTPEQYLTLKTFRGLYKYYVKNKDIDIHKYERRINEELEIINSKGFAPYILKIIENAEYCLEEDIPMGPGRGSAAGSLCLFCNNVTKVIDPIKYDLLFFRFLTKDRKDPPDCFIAA